LPVEHSTQSLPRGTRTSSPPQPLARARRDLGNSLRCGAHCQSPRSPAPPTCRGDGLMQHLHREIHGRGLTGLTSRTGYKGRPMHFFLLLPPLFSTSHQPPIRRRDSHGRNSLPSWSHADNTSVVAVVGQGVSTRCLECARGSIWRNRSSARR
jgi:hypothetical protein